MLTIAIFGATGNQGGSVARSLLKNPSFQVRALTRNTASEASQALVKQGAQIVQANGFRHDEMVAAFSGAWAAFVNTNSEDKSLRTAEGPTEIDLGKAVVNAAAEAGVKYLVFSSGPPCGEMTGGKVKFNAMEHKYEIEQYAKKLAAFETVTPVTAGWYFENLADRDLAPICGGFPFVEDDEGYLTLELPQWGGNNLVPYLAMHDDFGDIVHGIFLNPQEHRGRVVQAASQLLTFEQLVSEFEHVTGRKSRYQEIPWEAFDPCGIPGMEDVKLMFKFTQLSDGHYFGTSPCEVQTASALKRAVAAELLLEATDGVLHEARTWFCANFGVQEEGTNAPHVEDSRLKIKSH